MRKPITKILILTVVLLSICGDSTSQLYRSRGYPNRNGNYMPGNGFRNRGVISPFTFGNSRLISRNGQIIQKKKDGFFKKFLKKRPRSFKNFGKIGKKDDDGPTWKDYIENSYNFPACSNFMLSYDLSSRLVPDAVLRNWIVDSLCQELFFGMMLPFVSTIMGTENFEDMEFEAS